MADVITRLKLESGEYDSKVKRATQSLLHMEAECRKVGQTMATAGKEQVAFARSLGQMETVSTHVRGKLNELTQSYTELMVQYKRLSDEEKRSPFGRALSSSLDQLKGRIADTKQQLADVGKELQGSSGKFGQFGGVIDTLGQRLGVSGNLTELLTSRTAMLTAGVGAAIAVIGKATEAWASYNAEIAKQDQVTTVTTGLKGEDADRMTDSIRAMVDTYKVDFRDAVNAANTLMTQFGKSGDGAIQLLRDGLQGMIQGDGPKLLTMIQQYAPAFHDAGITASELVAIIHNSEGGIFTDQNMNAIVMGIKNIRLMTKQTSDALAELGINGEEMTKKLNEGSMSVFDALKIVVGQLKNAEAGSQTAGEVMQAVFGRQGVTAGTNLAEAIETLNLNLDETKRQTGEVGDAYAQLEHANERLNTAIRDCFGYDGWDQMAKGIKANLIEALSSVLGWTGRIKSSLEDIGSNTAFGRLAKAANMSLNPLSQVYKMLRLIAQERGHDGDVSAGEEIGRLIGGSGGGGDNSNLFNVPPVRTPKTPKTPKTTTNEVEKTEAQINSAAIQKLTNEYIKASEERRTAIREEIKVLQERNAEIQKLVNEAQGKGEKQTVKLVEQNISEINKGGSILGGDFLKPGSVDYAAPFKALNEEIDRLIKLRDEATTPEEWKRLNEEVNGVKKRKEDFTGGKDKDKGKDKGGKETEVKLLGEVQRMTAGIGQITGGIEQLGIELPQGIKDVMNGISGVISVLSGIATVVTAIQAISAADTIIPFARGGIVHAAGGYKVPGRHFSGDNIPAALDSGELVLNRAQQGNLASQLEGGPRVEVSGVLSGENIFMAANRYGIRSGKGELVTWKG